MSHIDANTAVLDALGIDYKGKHVAAVTIRLRHDTPPTVHIVRHIFDFSLNPAAVKVIDQHFKLTRHNIKPPTFDLDEACQEALQRVTERINQKCAALQRDTRHEFAWSWKDLNRVFGGHA